MITTPDNLSIMYQFRRVIGDFGIPPFPGQVIFDNKGLVTFTGSRTRDKVVGFRSKIKRNVNAVGPYSRDTYHVRVDQPGYARLQLPYKSALPPFDRERWETLTGQAGGIPANPVHHLSTVGSTADSLALQRVLDKIRNTHGHATGLISLGEMRETIGMLRSPFKSSLDLLSKYAKDCEAIARAKPSARRNVSKKVTRRDAQRAVSDAWLETTFGLLPLISDVEQIAEAVARFGHDNPPSRVRGRSTFKTEFSYGESSNKWGMIRVKTKSAKATEHRVQYVAGLDHSSIAFGSAERLLDLFGFRLEEFVPTLWELTPWSFLVDYFSNVGNVINAASTDTSSVKWISKAVTTETVYTIASSFLPEPVDGYGVKSFVTRNALFQIRRTTFVRSSPSHLGWPQLTLKSPWGKPIKVGNMTALLHSQLLGASRKFT